MIKGGLRIESVTRIVVAKLALLSVPSKLGNYIINSLSNGYDK